MLNTSPENSVVLEPSAPSNTVYATFVEVDDEVPPPLDAEDFPHFIGIDDDRLELGIQMPAQEAEDA